MQQHTLYLKSQIERHKTRHISLSNKVQIVLVSILTVCVRG